jgi:pimeloyl-ACP methyl ester carboxylesterase
VVDGQLPKDSDPALRDRLREQLAAAPPAVAVPLLRASLEFDLAAACERLRVPIREIATTASDATAGRRHAADFLIADLAAMQLGHFPMLTAPEQFDRQLAETLAGLGIAGPGALTRGPHTACAAAPETSYGCNLAAQFVSI